MTERKNRIKRKAAVEEEEAGVEKKRKVKRKIAKAAESLVKNPPRRKRIRNNHILWQKMFKLKITHLKNN
jgi:hypothetical protein